VGRLSIATLLALLTLLAGSAAARLRSTAAREGIVSAALVYEQSSAGTGGLTLSNFVLEISRAGRPFYERPVASRLCHSSCLLETADGGPLLVKDLEGNHQPDVALELNSGGAHCCSIVQIFAFDPGVKTYRPIEHNFRDAGALLTDVSGDGRLEFESADDRFAYEFASFAYSGLPLQIWRFHDRRLRDATREFPKALAADASRQLSRFRANRRKALGLGFIAAWAADEYLLGHRALVSGTLAAEARRHRLNSADGLSPGGRAFIAKLKRFLKKTGYA
jgi:hypothetical protein